MNHFCYMNLVQVDRDEFRCMICEKRFFKFILKIKQ